jgi:hypothetical protein
MKLNVTFFMLLSAVTLTISYCPKKVSALIIDKSNLEYHQHNQPTNRRITVSILSMELSDVYIFRGIKLISVGSLSMANELS